MRLLVLGGTAPLGSAVASHARDAGHAVTCLARGRSGDVPPGVRLVRADRDLPGAYDEVRTADWDAVVELSWQPGQVRRALAALAPQAMHWTYVSSISVYAASDRPGEDESAAVLDPLADDVATVTAEAYGAAKVTCERASSNALGDRLHASRAGLLGGPGDRSDRLGYWPARFARGGDVLVPTAAGQWAQALDFRDYAAFLVTAAGDQVVGTLHAVGEALPLPDVLEVARQVGGAGTPVVVADGWLVDQGVEPWAGPESLPLWLPDPADAGSARRSDAAAVAAGLRRRPLRETLADVLVDERRLGLDRERRAGLSPARERELLEAWRAASPP